ncbi:hypothetical protein COCCADRAFT_27284 [Bipolaris zeicola 26-R-13]|uniref:Uncharacterized protein n=1 Tax=Cochliobolus carbonum (strain 26-R-13) TaxID=930089 RepID=W6Y2F0_COCC2|nr:uncharacterized protein COCCADRAFT_27284 [Bipolaris zeicola 26-R-13]EUC32118.1 hypothetical protein COCCADRAFT_27284 [Bipolaris zeicola 26-R-13]
MINPKPTSRPTSPTLQHPVPQRPATLRRRISSGLDTFMSVLQLRKTTPKQDPAPRPITAPAPIRPFVHQGINIAQATEKQGPTPELHQPSRGEYEQPCPYDRTKYHSFSIIERSRCTFCGMRSSRPSSSEPCHDCRSKSPFSHIKMGFRQKLTPEDNKNIRHSNSNFSLGPSTSSDEGPRIVSPEIAAKRIGNPPRRAALPIPRPGAISNILNPPSDHPAFRPPEHNLISSAGSAPKGNDVRTTSPKLHYLHGLPDSKAYPYVHKREVKDHLAAIDAGVSSPLAEFAFTVNRQKERNRYTDFSETVFYGSCPSPTLVSDVHRLLPEQSRRSNTIVEHTLVVGGHVVPKRSQAQQQRSIDEQLYDSDVYAQRSLTLQAPRTGTSRPCSRNEIHGTIPTSSTHKNSRKNERSMHKPGFDGGNVPRLRGGAGTHQDSPINSTYPSSTPPTIVPCLRGGGGSPSALRDQDNLPPTLVWLAGGKRKITTVAKWKEKKPKVRMGGMLGWAVYGSRAGEVVMGAWQRCKTVHQKRRRELR